MRVGDGSFRDGRLDTSPKTHGPIKKEPVGHTKERPAPPEPKEASEPMSPFARILRGLGREVDHGEKVVNRALNAGAGGQELGTGDLLALQAGVYRYSEAVDLSAKLIDRGTNGVKTVLQGQ
jgi:hypothetical protein